VLPEGVVVFLPGQVMNNFTFCKKLCYINVKEYCTYLPTLVVPDHAWITKIGSQGMRKRCSAAGTIRPSNAITRAFAVLKKRYHLLPLFG
jgi:hypothetical protein